MSAQEVMLAKLTRREFRQAIESGNFSTAIVGIASNEQHLEHLAMEHDLASVTYIAREAAKRLYPQVIVTVPMAVGISEHHMIHKGTISARPGGWLAVLFDVVESLVRHGVKNVLIFNGHGGNTLPVMGVMDQWRYYLKSNAPGVNLQFCSYWELIPQGFPATAHGNGRYPRARQRVRNSHWPGAISGECPAGCHAGSGG